jgi:hypothetical protein
VATNRIEQEIVVKVIGGKDVGALAKEIKDLEKQKAKIVVGVDADTDEAKSKIEAIDKQLADLRGEKAELEVTAKINQALDALDEVAAEAKRAEAAAEALGVALGPELGSKADLDGIISDFNRMGLSMDEITANADKLGAKLRDVGTKDVGGRLTTGLGRASGEMKSAGSSASVMANALGNATQDIGAVAGLSGTAGVAIGQMGEYMSDAAFSGEGLRTVLANFGKIAGPIAVLVGALQIVNGAMAAHKKAAEDSAAASEQLGDAMDSAADPALGLANNLKPVIDRLEHFDRADPGFWTDFTAGVESLAGSLPGAGAALGLFGVDVDDLIDSVSDVMPALRKAGVDAFDLSRFIAGSGEAAATKVSRAYQAGIINAEEYVAALKAITDEREKAADVKASDDAFFKVSLGQLRALDEAADKAADPLDFFKDQWGLLMDDLRDGSIDLESTAAAVQFLVDNLNLTPDQIRTIALDEVKRKTDEVADAQEKAAKQAKDWAKAQQDAANDAADAMGDALIAIGDMASNFSTMERNKDAIGKAFALGNAPLEALQAVTDINDAIRDLGKFISDNKGVVPNIFDPNDVQAGPFLAKIQSLRGPIQDAVGDAFATGGPPAAKATAEAYVEQITASMRGKLTKDEVRNLLSLGDLDAVLKIAVDQSSLAAAKQMLEILTGVQGETPWTAEIQLALAAGDITPDAARILISQRLEKLGIDVPTALEEPSEGSKTSAKAAADRWAAEHPVDMQSNVDDPDIRSLIEAREGGQDWADDHPIVWPSKVVSPRSVFGLFDAGGTVPAAGGIAGERGPEIIDDRWVTTGTTYVPPGTKVTSRRRTAVILNQHGGRGLRRYDSGGVVPAGPITVNFNGVGTIGNSFDIDRQVRRSLHRIQRLYGTR